MARTHSTNGKDLSLSTEDLAAQLAALKSDLSDLTALIAQNGAETSETIAHKATEAVKTAQHTVASHAEDAMVHAELLGGEAKAFIGRQPATALGIAAGVGFLVGLMSTRQK